jgi:hypothetical protein
MKFHEHALSSDGRRGRQEMGDMICAPGRYERKIATFVDRHVFLSSGYSGKAAPFHQLSNLFPLRINGLDTT